MSESKGRFRRLCAWIVGIVFTVSGALKLMDPTGAGLVMEEYFKFLHLGFLSPISMSAGIAFALAEAVTGVALITGVWRKLTAAISSLLMAFFTILTILLVIFNPEMDCGCFGEAIHLTHLQTFLKNIVLCQRPFEFHKSILAQKELARCSIHHASQQSAIHHV